MIRTGLCALHKHAALQTVRALSSSPTSPGVVVDPFVPKPKDKASTSFFSSAGITSMRENMGTVAKSSFAAGRIRKSIDNFKPSNFGREAEALFAQLNAAFADGDLGALDRLVTEQLYQSLKNQVKQDNKRFKEKKKKGKKGRAPKVQRKAYYVLSFPEPASIMQLRLLQHDPKDPTLAFGQVTVKIRSERAVAKFNERGNALPPLQLSGGVLPAAETTLPAEDDGEWKEATDEDGTKYYWHTVTKESRWELPSEETEEAEPTTGASTGSDSTAADGEDVETIDTVSYVVFETALFGQEKMWRVCMIDERGPETDE
jgi:hypothetical protein